MGRYNTDRNGVRISVAVTERWGFRILVWADPRVYPDLNRPLEAPPTSVPDLEPPWVPVFCYSLGGEAGINDEAVFKKARRFRDSLRQQILGTTVQSWLLASGAATLKVIPRGDLGFPFHLQVICPGRASVGCPVKRSELVEAHELLTSFFELDDPVSA